MTLRLHRHHATTAQLCALYPCHAGRALSAEGLYLGRDVLSGGAFCFDPFHLYATGHLTSPNVLLLGDLGSGKSAATKCFLARSIGLLGRQVAIVDPKGEYTPLAEAFGLSVLKLHPGGTCRLNPLEALDGEGGTDRDTRRVGLIVALLAAAARRDLQPVEEAAITYALDALARDAKPTLGDVAHLLAVPTSEMAQRAGLPIDALRDRLEALRFAMARLLDGPLRGMFDGQSTVPAAAAATRRGVVLDVSAVFHDPAALTVVMVAATGWLTGLLTGPSDPGTRRVQVIDECWALLSDVRVARYFQACWKLSRAYGVANIAIAHRVGDLRAQADDGTSAAKVAVGLLADAQTRVLFRQPPDQVAEAAHLLGLTQPEAELLPHLGRGRALWHVGNHAAVVQHAIGPGEHSFCDTDGRLR